MRGQTASGLGELDFAFTNSCSRHRDLVAISGLSLQDRGYFVMKRFIAPCALAIGLTVCLGACSDPYDPNQLAVGGGLLGAGAGAAIGGLAGGGRGALAGGLLGGAAGAVGGAVTTPRPPPPRYEEPNYPPPPPRYNSY
jgi:hypothetical protein